MTPGKAHLTSDEIRPLAARSNLMGAWLVAHCWGTIVLAITVFALWPNPATFALAVLLIGSRQLGLAILMHEAAHNALFKSRRVNAWVGTWLCGWPIMADLASYRHYHLTHHKFTQTDKDPDLVLSAKFPTTHASMRRKFTRDLTGRTGLRNIAAQISAYIQFAGDDDAIEAAEAQATQTFKSNALHKAFPTFFGIALAISLAGDWWWGLAFWVLPYLTWFQFVLRVRNIAEHGAVERSDNPLQNVRTTHAGPIARALVAPYYVNYHLEHHMVMHVPCWQLPRMHALLMNKGLDGQMRVCPNYLTAMREAGWRST